MGKSGVGMEVKRFDVFVINTDPAIDCEIKKTTPCLIISPDEMNRFISTVIVAPMTTKCAKCPTRIPCTFLGKKGQIILEQIGAVDKERLIEKLGAISKKSQNKTLNILQEMFAA